MIEPIVQITVSEYQKLQAEAKLSTKQIKLLAKEELQKIREKQAIDFRLRFCSKEWSDEEVFLSINSYEELTPQMKHIAYKLEIWAHEELKEIHGEYNLVNTLKKEKAEDYRFINKLTLIMVLGYFLAIVFAVCFFITWYLKK
jgi:hypothetical protein